MEAWRPQVCTMIATPVSATGWTFCLLKNLVTRSRANNRVFFWQERMHVANVSNTFYDTNFDAESPLQAGCIGDLNREWHHFSNLGLLRSSDSGGPHGCASKELGKRSGFHPGVSSRGEASCRRTPYCYRYVVLRTRSNRSFKQVSPLGTRHTWRAGPLGRRLTLVANRHAGKAYLRRPVDNVACEIVKFAEVIRTLSAIISELRSVPIGDTNILVTGDWR